MTIVNDLCQEWHAENPAPAGRIDDLVARFLCTEGRGHLVSELFPTCKKCFSLFVQLKIVHTGAFLFTVCLLSSLGFSNPPSVWNFFRSLGETWPEFAYFLGYTEEQVASITERSPHNPDLQIRCFLRAFQLPDIGPKTKCALMQATRDAITCSYKG